MWNPQILREWQGYCQTGLHAEFIRKSRREIAAGNYITHEEFKEILGIPNNDRPSTDTDGECQETC
jgi:hypothetical protein